jgi:NAD(P)H-hydrate epimerase
MLVVSTAEIRALDREVIDGVGVPGAVLMDAAGKGVAELARDLSVSGRGEVVVFAGAGNNGGDGFVAARHLANWGVHTTVILCAPQQNVRGDALIHLRACEKSGVTVLDGSTPEGLAAATVATARARVVVDALFGTGLDREVTGHLADAIGRINAHAGVKVAVDVPSGMDADRGQPLGVCVRADHTVTFAFPKRGLVGAPGFTLAGRVHVVDIGIPEKLAIARGVAMRLLDDAALEPLALPADPLAHKGTRGHLLIVAGSVGKSGAALLCGSAALRAGAGLVTLAAPAALQPVVEGRVLELMTTFYGDDFATLGQALTEALRGKRAWAAGPGMPHATEMREILRKLAARGLPLVFDADALNHLAEAPEILESRPPSVLTPHPGEAARLLRSTVAEVQADRVAAAEKIAARFSAVAVLKGARTVIAGGGRLAICPTGGPALGSGGTGDVLTGIVGALLGRGVAPFEAACAAVYAHGKAGDLLAAERGGLVAHELVETLPRLMTKRHESD